MLVLSRKIGERLVIGDGITVVVNRIAGNRVTLGIEAPQDVRIVRGELRPMADELAPVKETRLHEAYVEQGTSDSFLRLAK
jgi:carbon storage regulator